MQTADRMGERVKKIGTSEIAHKFTKTEVASHRDNKGELKMG